MKTLKTRFDRQSRFAPPIRRARLEKKFAELWGDSLAEHGFTQIPNLLIRYHRKLDLTPQEVLWVLVILSYQWTHEAAFPSHDQVAADLGVTRQTAIRLSRSVEEKGCVTISKTPGRSNAYDVIGPLSAKLRAVAAELQSKNQSGVVSNEEPEPAQTSNEAQLHEEDSLSQKDNNTHNLLSRFGKSPLSRPEGLKSDEPDEQPSMSKDLDEDSLGRLDYCPPGVGRGVWEAARRRYLRQQGNGPDAKNLLKGKDAARVEKT